MAGVRKGAPRDAYGGQRGGSVGPPEPCTLVIGWGNPVRGDDGVGWHVARAARDAAPDGSLRILTAHQLAPEHAEDVAAHTRVVFVDASCDAAPGTVAVRAVAPADRPPSGFSHQLDPAQVLRLARLAYGRGPDVAWLVTIGAADLGCGETVSPVVAGATERARDLVLRLARGEEVGIAPLARSSPEDP